MPRGQWVPQDGLVTPPLFEGVGPIVRKGNETRESADSKRHRKQEVEAGKGIHPITKGPLHPEALKGFAHESKAPFTCGTCWFREQVGKAMKCKAHDERYATSSVTTNVLAEFPACTAYVKFGGSA